MYYKCTWCKTRIISEPTYFTEGFRQLAPGFEVYCSAVCSLDAFQAKFILRAKPQHNSLIRLSQKG